jgi:polyisoprenoid-binding protein YceI
VPRYRVKQEESTVDIDLNVNVHPSHVRARELTGTLECELDEHQRPRLEARYSAELTLPVQSIKSGIGVQDMEMRRRLDTGRFPTITAALIEARKLARDGHYHATFEISMHGQTRRVEGDAVLEVGDGTLTIDGEQKINMKDFGINPPRLLFLKVDEVVNVRAHIVAEQS